MFSNMKPAEERLLEACQKGEVLNLADERPRKKTDNNEIRGEFLRTLILSNNQEIAVNGNRYILKIDPRGIDFRGIFISGVFDFSFCNTDLSFTFINSFFEEEIRLINSKIKILNLTGTLVKLISAQKLICDSDIFLRDGFKSKGKIDFISAQIGGSLICTNGKFKNKNSVALNFNSSKIDGNVQLNGFEANGKVEFSYAQIGVGFDCTNGKLINKNETALTFNSSKIDGNVLLGEGFCISGNLDFTASQIGKVKVSEKIRIKGSCLFEFMKVNTILIEKLNFHKIILNKKGFKKLHLDGLVYNHLSGVNLDSITLINWLSKMPKFKPQPYKQLAKVLRNMGHNEDANNIMIEYNDIITSKSKNWFIKILKKIYGFTAAYGYKPMRVLGTMFMVWFLCSLFYWNASKVAVFAPTNPLVFQKKDSYICNVNSNGTPLLDFFNYSKYNSSNNWILNENLEGEYTTFNPFLYSLDVILPIVDLQVEKDWGQYISSNNGTLNDFTRWIMWFEILFGWTYSLILVAILSGLAKNEKD
ncbi:hypothetical protein ACOL3I_02070 [Aliarcobacter butzleri]